MNKTIFFVEQNKIKFCLYLLLPTPPIFSWTIHLGSHTHHSTKTTLVNNLISLNPVVTSQSFPHNLSAAFDTVDFSPTPCNVLFTYFPEHYSSGFPFTIVSAPSRSPVWILPYPPISKVLGVLYYVFRSQLFFLCIQIWIYPVS